MNLIALPAFTDNYIWMVHDGARAIVVDPGDSAPVIAALESLRLTLAGILVTHHHADHIGGLAGLRSSLKGPVYGPAREDIPAPYTPLRDGDHVELLGLGFQVIDVPGHTAGHIAYFHPAARGERPVLFCGDTMFSAGCGRLFEGTPAQMHASLSRLAALPGATRVCCAHEYTLANLKFAHAVEPSNDDLATYTRWCEQQRAAGISTLPSSIEQERKVNPFLRCAEPEVIQSARAHGAVSESGTEVFAALRRWKNEFR
ncbi:MAG TPA: hydroxyacylglutathione hydrolase [Albitalea sp.]|uniref:hydroxyacylglutathione hydrolase n=1 Tax=Piscinibacter sp. TaxID=1903157 RepID=UPI002ED48948